MWIIISWIAISLFSAFVFGAIASARGPSEDECLKRKDSEADFDQGALKFLE